MKELVPEYDFFIIFEVQDMLQACTTFEGEPQLTAARALSRVNVDIAVPRAFEI